jgi:hypothetical protein
MQTFFRTSGGPTRTGRSTTTFWKNVPAKRIELNEFVRHQLSQRIFLANDLIIHSKSFTDSTDRSGLLVF